VCEILGRDRDVLALGLRLREGLHGTRRPAPYGDHGLEITEELDDPPSRDELDQVKPVRADVADGA
jgi:hypothetical protein